MGRKPALDLALIHLTIEGIAAKGGGVCTVTRGHLAALPRVRRALAKHGVRITPYFVETHFGPTYDNWDPEFLAKAKAQIQAMGGEFYTALNASPNGHPVSANYPGGEDFFGTPEQIQLEAMAAASIARSIGRRHQHTVVWCHDTFFIMSPIYGTMQDNDESMHWIRVVHSTTLKHDREPVDPMKIGMEYASFYWAKRFPNVSIGTISDYIRDHLIADYAADPKTIIPTRNGVDPLDPKYKNRSEHQIRAKVRECNKKLKAEGKGHSAVPENRPFMLSFGRPVPYKRLALTLDAAKASGGAYHPVIVTLGPDPATEAHAKKLGIAASVIDAFDFDLCACLAQHPNCVGVPILAYNEPFGLIPAEVRLLVRKQGGLLIVPADGGGLAEQVTDGVDGFCVKKPDPKSVADCVAKIDKLPEAAKRKIRNAGLDLVFSGGYTWSSRIIETLSAVIPEVSRVGNKVLREIAKAERARVSK
jgi:glycosyltransferase involved in cell wall biosynthesis